MYTFTRIEDNYVSEEYKRRLTLAGPGHIQGWFAHSDAVRSNHFCHFDYHYRILKDELQLRVKNGELHE